MSVQYYCTPLLCGLFSNKACPNVLEQGTILNTGLVALPLWGLSAVGALTADIGFLHIVIFCALIAAVDPVAVLAIFQEVGVNKMLYFLVFGESLLNGWLNG